ncbi:MAG: hypothetical protein KF861_11205 [Planctomycetaceae bacterium]|nr:hypothetical protein [Planctomycetaceae bacterium]
MILIRTLAVLWALPNTAIGLAVGTLGLMTGGHVQRVGHTVEFHGGFVNRLLQHLPVKPIALTLGHVVLGQSAAALDMSREHEWVHVRQYERWGPLFLPAYLACSLWLWMQRRDAYRCNPFEHEAFEHDRLCARGEMNRKAPDRPV